jgi:hypothetical protein
VSLVHKSKHQYDKSTSIMTVCEVFQAKYISQSRTIKFISTRWPRSTTIHYEKCCQILYDKG